MDGEGPLEECEIAGGSSAKAVLRMQSFGSLWSTHRRMRLLVSFAHLPPTRPLQLLLLLLYGSNQTRASKMDKHAFQLTAAHDIAQLEKEHSKSNFSGAD